MAKRFKLRELEKKHGDLHKVIPPLVNENGQDEAARTLETTQATISNWLRANGYVKRATWERDEPEQPVLEATEA
jgi:hypothetical protein